MSYGCWIWRRRRRRRRRRRWTKLPIIAPYIYDARYHANHYILSTTVLSDITPLKECWLQISSVPTLSSRTVAGIWVSPTNWDINYWILSQWLPLGTNQPRSHKKSETTFDWLYQSTQQSVGECGIQTLCRRNPRWGTGVLSGRLNSYLARQESIIILVCVCVCVVEFWRTLLFCQGFFYCVLSAQLMSVRWITEAASRFVPILSSLRTVAVETDMSWTTMESLAQVKIECSYCICTV